MPYYSKWLPGLAVLGVAAATAATLLGHAGQAPVAHPNPPATLQQAEAADSIRYPAGAAQLDMLHTATVKLQPMPVAEPLSARVTYDDDVTARIGVSVAARVHAIRAVVGQQVRAGQVLAELDAPDYSAALADLDKARADETRKRQALERARTLVPGEAIAGREMEAAQADYQQARAETVRAEQRLRSLTPAGLRADRQHLLLTSPLDGVISERNLSPALDVAPGMAAPLFVVTNPKRLWLQLDVPENLLPQLHKGGRVEVESDAYPGQHFSATLSEPGLVIDPNTRRVLVRAKLDNSSARLLPEMYLRATLLQDSGSAMRVPNSALVNRGVHTYVFVQHDSGQFRRVAVHMLTHGAEASYISGVADGSNIVTSGALLLDADLSARAGSAP